jgi:hypothetical protein
VVVGNWTQVVAGYGTNEVLINGVVLERSTNPFDFRIRKCFRLVVNRPSRVRSTHGA